MGLGGVVLRILAEGVRVLQFLAGAVILGIFSYFLAALSSHHQTIAQWIKAVEGLSGAATLYALLAVLLTLCLGGVMFFGLVAMVLDVCFIGAMIAIAIMTRHGTQTCSATVITPLGTGSSNSSATGSGFNLGLACRLEKTVFAVSIISIFLFIASFSLAIPMVRHHRREKRFGPSPANGYTSGSTRRRFWRRNKNTAPYPDAPADTLPGHPTPGEVETGYKPETTGYNSTRF